MFIKVKGETRSQNPERRRTVHLQAGHAVKDHHVADWKVKVTGFSNLLRLQYAKSRFHPSRQIKVCSRPLI
jgi:hypothetical protein